MADKVGVYICSGCGISDVVDTDKLLGAASGAVSKQVHEHFCGPEGLALIKQDLEGESPKVNGVVIAACSQRVIRVLDGKIVSDERQVPLAATTAI